MLKQKSSLFLILVFYYRVQICEGPIGYPFTYEDEKHFQGEFCEQDSDILEKICLKYEETQKFSANLDGNEDSKCTLLKVQLYSEEIKNYKEAERNMLLCKFYSETDGNFTEGLSRGKDKYDVAEYTETSKGWAPATNHAGLLQGIIP